MRKLPRIRGLRWKILFFVVFAIAVALFWALELHCVWESVFSVPCLGCGLTRAFKCLVAGDLRGAFLWHFMFWSVPIFIWALLYDGKITGKKRIDFSIYLLLGTGFCIRWLLCFF